MEAGVKRTLPLCAAASAAGLIQPELLADGQVCVDMGEPILEGPKVPTTLAPTQVRHRLGQLQDKSVNTLKHLGAHNTCDYMPVHVWFDSVG